MFICQLICQLLYRLYRNFLEKYDHEYLTLEEENKKRVVALKN